MSMLEVAHAANEQDEAVAQAGRGVERYNALAELLEERRGKSHLVIMMGTPDPDAISSGMALSFLCESFEISTTLLSFTSPSHHENRALVKRLGIDVLLYGEGFDLSAFDFYSIVDSQKYKTPIDKRLVDAGVQFLSFIDHHRELSEAPPALHVDVRSHVGSTAGILCQYLQLRFPKGLEPSEPSHVTLATALMHGMRSDTSKFLLASRRDYTGAAFISPCVDSQVIESIEQRFLTSGVLGILENALVRRRAIDNFIFSDVGFVRAGDRDGIPQAADLLLAREGTDTVLVVGVVDEKYIDGSFRTRSQTINPDEFLKGFLGASPESGQFYGGGNIRDRGGFQVPLGFVGLHEDKQQVYAMALQIIEKSFLDYIGKATSSVNAKQPAKVRE